MIHDDHRVAAAAAQRWISRGTGALRGLRQPGRRPPNLANAAPIFPCCQSGKCTNGMTENYNKAAGPPCTPLSRSDDTAAAPVMPAAPGHQHQTNAADIAFPTRRLRLRTLSLSPAHYQPPRGSSGRRTESLDCTRICGGGR